MIRLLALATVLHAGYALAGNAACSTRSTDARMHVVELYTSEGCDSCPPAEHWMSSLLQHAELVGLEFHVNYWDSGEWNDPFDNAAFTERQRMISRRGADGQYYTPQIWLDGKLWHNWPKGSPPEPHAGHAPSLSLAAGLSDTLQARVDVEDAAGATDDLGIYVAVTENGLSSTVRGGENRGKKLAHDEVVRALAGPLALPHATAEFRLPPKMDTAKSAIVAFVQSKGDGTIVQVVRLPLEQCR
jgi:hypothetical protein